jgi:ADP-ribose pyrophosphatase
VFEKPIKKDKIYSGTVDFYCDEVELPNGKKTRREYLSQPGACGVLAFVNKQSIVLVRQFRYAVNKTTFELPAGKMDKNETPQDCAVRELKEETGYSSGKIEKMLSFHPTTAFSNETLHIFKAFELIKGNSNPDDDEFVSAEIVDFRDALKMLAGGEIVDAKTIIALLYFENSLLK